MEHSEDAQERIERLAVLAGEDVDAFTELYRFYQPRIFRYVLSRVGIAADAEDITAATFEKALRNIERFDPKRAKFFTWLYQIASNTATDYLRKHKRVKVGVEDIGEAFGGNGLVSDIDVENYVTTVQLLQELPRSYQEVLALRYFEGLSVGDIAEVLAVSRGNVSTRLYRGLKAMGVVMKERETAAAGKYHARQRG